MHCKMASFPVSCTMALVHYMTAVPHKGFDRMVRMSLKLNFYFYYITVETCLECITTQPYKVFENF